MTAASQKRGVTVLTAVTMYLVETKNNLLWLLFSGLSGREGMVAGEACQWQWELIEIPQYDPAETIQSYRQTEPEGQPLGTCFHQPGPVS